MPDGILPALLVVQLIRKSPHDETIDLTQRHFAIRTGRDCHGDQGNVGVWRLLPWLLK